MIDFTPFHSIRDKLENNSLKINIDTLRTSVNKSTIRNYIDKKGFNLKRAENHSKISINTKKKLWTKEVTSLYYLLVPPAFKNIILSTPHKINQQSDYKAFMLTAYGLFQPHKPLHVESKKELEQIFNKFSVKSFDLAIDSPSPINLEDLRSFGMINHFHNTDYINNPLNLHHISKIKIYDKARQLREQQGVIIEPLHRLELTVQTKGKLRDMFVPLEEIEAVINKYSIA